MPRYIDAKETKADKARQLRYKRSALQSVGYQTIKDELCEIQETCEEFRWYMDDDDSLIDAMDGDEDEAYEFKMLFCDLAGKCESLFNILTDYNMDPDLYDDCTVAIVGGKYNVIGFDTYEDDYFTLTSYEGEMAATESGKRIMRLTKAEMLSTWGQCLGIVMSFLDLRYRYDYLKASFDVLKSKNTGILQVIKDIEVAYEEAERDGFYSFEDSTKRLDQLLNSFTDYDKIWVQ